MDSPVQYSPASCPGCSLPFEVKYSHYQRAKRHPAFYVMLIVGITFTIGMTVVAGEVGVQTVDYWLAGRWADRHTLGLLFFCGFIPTFAVNIVLTRIWWSWLNRIPRVFNIRCRECPWHGKGRVVDQRW